MEWECEGHDDWWTTDSRFHVGRESESMGTWFAIDIQAGTGSEGLPSLEAGKALCETWARESEAA